MTQINKIAARTAVLGDLGKSLAGIVNLTQQRQLRQSQPTRGANIVRTECSRANGNRAILCEAGKSLRGTECATPGKDIAMADPFVLYEVDDNVGIVTLNRPDKLNAISHELQHALTEALACADADPATSVVLLRAEGRSFCAGYDIGAKGPDGDDWRSDPTKAHAHLQP
jgi:hypothetical protein